MSDETGKPASAYAWYALGVLVLVYMLNFIDRQILSILANDIKADLGLRDDQLGFLYGTAFAIFYALFGVPLGRLADGSNRVRLLTIGLGLWSFMTALSGFARNAATLAFARIGVGVGEASVPRMRLFNAHVLGIRETDFVTQTQGTFKLGIQFNDWARIGDSYVHGFGTIGRSLGPLPFHQFWLKRFLAGHAPDIGAYEAGSDLPEYGPRRPRIIGRPLPPLQRPIGGAQGAKPLPRTQPARR